MCIKIVGESEFNAVVFLSVDTNNSWKSLDINKEDIQTAVKQLIDTAYGLLEIADSDRDSDQHENAMNLYIKCKFYSKRDKQLRKILLANKKSKRMWPLDFVNRKPKGFYCVCKGRLRFSKRNA